MSRRSPATSHDSAQRTFLIASGVGALFGVILFAVILQGARGGLLSNDLLGNFYDGQARAILDGHLDVDPAIPGFEGFRVGDKTYIYQGLTPVLFRLPILAATSAFDGRLTGLSMILAFSVTMAYVVAASSRIRGLLRGRSIVGRSEALVTAVATFGIGGGSVLFLASKAWVYHEAAIWGVALTLGSLTHLVYWVTSPPDGDSRRTPHLVASVVLAGLAVNTRSSIGLGPVAALGVTAVFLALGLLVSRRGSEVRSTGTASRPVRVAGWKPEGTRWTVVSLLTIVLGLLVGVGVYASVNFARFGSLISVPLDRQLLVVNDPQRQASLEANGNSLFGIQYAPSVLLQVLRPDAVALRSQFPYVGFPDERPTVVGNAVFAERDWSSSIPASEPLLLLAGLLGVVVVIAPRWVLSGPQGSESGNRSKDPDRQEPRSKDSDRQEPESDLRVLERGRRDLEADAELEGDDFEREPDGPRVESLRIPMLGAAIGCGAILVFGYIAERYLSDFYPFLVLSSIVGLHAVADRLSRHRVRAWSVTAGLLIAVMALWGVWVNASLALQYQREIAPGFSSVGRDRWLGLQLDFPGSFDPLRVETTESLPPRVSVGQLAIIGNCEALYRSSGDVWYLIEAGRSAGGHEIRISASGPLQGRVPLARATADDRDARLVLEPISNGRAVLVLRPEVSADSSGSDLPNPDGAPADNDVLRGPEFDLNSNQTGGFKLNLQVINDRRAGELIVTGSGYSSELFRHEVNIGTDLKPAEAPVGVSVRISGRGTPLCERLTERE